MTRLVLGSASPGRLKVLRQAGVEPLVVVSGVDEDLIAGRLGPDASPGELVSALARAKAEQVAGQLDSALDSTITADCVVIGCDSMLHIDGRLCGKPESVADARRQWQSMAGRAGRLYTGHCLIRLLDHEIVHSGTETSITTAASPGHPHPMTWRPTWPRANHCASPEDSPSTAWAGGSSTVSTATPRPWWASDCL